MDEDRRTVLFDDRTEHLAVLARAFGVGDERLGRRNHLLERPTRRVDTRDFLGRGGVEHDTRVVAAGRVVHRDEQFAHSRRQPVVAFLLFVAGAAEVDHEAHAQPVEQRQVGVGGLAQMRAAVERAAADPATVIGRTTAEITEVDDSFEGVVRHYFPL